MVKVIGIDLGTTNSVVACIEGNKPTVISNAEGERTTPSVVAYTKKGDLLVGQIAKRQAVINPENTFYSIKSFIGRKSDEIIDRSNKETYKKVYKNGLVKFDCPSIGKEFAAEEISSQILKKLAQDASKYLGEEVKQAVVTVPAYFNDSQRQATKDAGKIAGLEVLRIINEPTAAALAYGLDKKQNETILVFDLGGGTFDISILEVGDGVFEVLSTSGDTNFGGDAFDEKIVQWLIKDFKEKEGVDLSLNKQALQRLTEAAEKAKIELSTLHKTNINLPFICVVNNIPRHIDQEIKRNSFEELCKDLLNRCHGPIKIALEDAHLNVNDLNQNILVGGSTRIPSVQSLVKTTFDKEPNRSVNPDEVVAIGAAIQAGILSGEMKDILLLDVTPLSLGIETAGGMTTIVTPRNTVIPNKRVETFSTAADNQTSVEIRVLQGERKMSKDNKSLGLFTLDGIQPAGRGVPKIEVTFDLDANGLLMITAKDNATNKEQSVKITGSSNLSKEDVEEMVMEAEKNASNDDAEAEKAITKNKAEDLCSRMKKQLTDLKDELSADEKNQIISTLSELEKAIDSGDFINIKKLSEELVKFIR